MMAPGPKMIREGSANSKLIINKPEVKTRAFILGDPQTQHRVEDPGDAVLDGSFLAPPV